MVKYRLSELKQRLRSAACLLREEHKQINIAELSRKLDIHRDTLSNLLAFTIPEISLELELVKASGTDWNRLQIYHLLKEAALVVVNEGDKPCPLFIAEKLKWSRERVCRYFRNHPDLAVQIGLHTDSEAIVWRVGRRMRFNAELVTLITLSLSTGYSYSTLKKVFSRRPEFKTGLALQKGKKGFGQSLYERKLAKKRVNPKPYVPEWCRRSRRRICKPHLPASMVPVDRVVYIFELRYRLESGSLVHPSSQNSRHTHIRYLAMHLMKNDLRMSLVHIARTMNLSRGRQVTNGLMRLEPQLPLLESEIARLRKFCLGD